MKSLRIPQISVFLIPIIALVFMSSITFGQTDEGAGELEKSPQAEAYDQKALEKLKKMTPEEVDELDKLLAQALTLFYDREYARALPIFRNISDTVETMDVMFWLASCAAKSGEIDMAINKLNQMLDIDPNLHRVRLELATVYFGLARYDDARRELNKVLEAEPPEAVRNNIQKLLASIDEKTKRVFTNFRFSQGIKRDSNVSAGPDNSSIDVYLGGTLELTNTQYQLADWVTVTNMAGNVLYDGGEKNSWMWNTTGSFYQTHNLEYCQFDYTQARITTGPWWIGRKSILKIPFGYADNIYEHDKLYYTFEFSPTYEYFFTPGFSLRGKYSHTRDIYEPTTGPGDRSDQDNDTHIYEINPNFYFNNRNDILSFYITDKNVKAKGRRFTYDALSISVSYFKRFNLFDWDMEFYSRYKHTKKEYYTPALLWPEAYLRSDVKHNVYAVISRNFLNKYFVSLSWNWIDNRSNTSLYDFTKFFYGLDIGVKF